MAGTLKQLAGGNVAGVPSEEIAVTAGANQIAAPCLVFFIRLCDNGDNGSTLLLVNSTDAATPVVCKLAADSTIEVDSETWPNGIYLDTGARIVVTGTDATGYFAGRAV